MLLRRAAAGVLLAAIAAAAIGAPSGISTNPSTDSGVNQVPLAINAALGSGHVDSPIYVDYYTLTGASTSGIFQASQTGGANIESLATNTPDDHHVYQVVTYPVTSAPGDATNYALLYQNTLVVRGNGRGGPSTPVQLDLSSIPVSSPNSLDGTSSYGIEFGLSTTYLGLTTRDDSHDTGDLGGLILALEYGHPSWNPFDVRAVLRITAGNWASGYDHTNFGYGFVNWTSANTYAGTIYLQPPDTSITNYGYYASITVYPYAQSRRSYEIICTYNSGFSQPGGTNELTTSQVTGAGGACATELFSTQGLTGPTYTFGYAPAASGTVGLIAFTTDGAGDWSRVEQWSAQNESFTVGMSCVLQ